MRLTVSEDDLPRDESPSIASFVIRVQALSAGSLIPIPKEGKLGWLGRVEHVQSRRSATFDSPEELIRFVETCLGYQS